MELTFGQKSVGITFNHGEGEIHELVHKAKQTCADAIDMMDEIRKRSGSGGNYPLGDSPSERIALATIAIRKLQSAQMDMVKAITWKD
jgi:hypothetical protein